MPMFALLGLVACGLIGSADALVASRAAARGVSSRSDVHMEVKSWYDEKVKAEEEPAAEKSLIMDSEYILEQRQKMKESMPFGMSFDFSGTPSSKTAVRGEGGLNEQGYTAAPPPAEKGIPLALIPGVGLIIALCVYNQGSQ